MTVYHYKDHWQAVRNTLADVAAMAMRGVFPTTNQIERRIKDRVRGAYSPGMARGIQLSEGKKAIERAKTHYSIIDRLR